jgi:hypothetical protein
MVRIFQPAPPLRYPPKNPPPHGRLSCLINRVFRAACSAGVTGVSASARRQCSIRAAEDPAAEGVSGVGCCCRGSGGAVTEVARQPCSLCGARISIAGLPFGERVPGWLMARAWRQPQPSGESEREGVDGGGNVVDGAAAMGAEDEVSRVDGCSAGVANGEGIGELRLQFACPRDRELFVAGVQSVRPLPGHSDDCDISPPGGLTEEEEEEEEEGGGASVRGISAWRSSGLSVLVGVINLGGSEELPGNLVAWLPRGRYEAYVVGVQEGRGLGDAELRSRLQVGSACTQRPSGV